MRPPLETRAYIAPILGLALRLNCFCYAARNPAHSLQRPVAARAKTIGVRAACSRTGYGNGEVFLDSAFDLANPSLASSPATLRVSSVAFLRLVRCGHAGNAEPLADFTLHLVHPASAAPRRFDDRNLH